MNDQKGVWIRVTKEEPCGICEKPDWCVRGEKGWNCMRVESAKMLHNGGWYHPFDESKPMPPPPRPAKARPPAPDFAALMARYWREDHPMLNEQAEALGLPVEAIKQLGAAWAEDRNAMAIPMHDATHHDRTRPVGIRLRTADGKKFAVTGSTSGIFYPYRALHLSTDRIYICEGPTDTAAAIAMGCFAVGRAACRGGEGIILSVLDQLNPNEVVIVTDNDSPGVSGAKDLMRHIKQPKCQLTPPTKDLRSFRDSGGTRELLEGMLKDITMTRFQPLPNL